jgi:hypothetical protein
MAALCLLALTALTGCTTEADFRQSMDSWTGRTEQELVSQLGPPDGFYESGDTRYLTYAHNNTVIMPGTQPTYQSTVIGNTIYTNSYGGTSPQAVSLSCSRTFEVRAQRVRGWSAKGNNCYDF